MIDTGANKNFIREDILTKKIPIQKTFNVASVGGTVPIKYKVVLKLFESIGNSIKYDFFVLPTLSGFCGIIGDDTLRDLGAIIDRSNNVLKIKNYKIPLKARISSDVYFTLGKDLPHGVNDRLNLLLKKYSDLFKPLNGNELVNTNIRAEIRTSTSEPIYSKSYPYPACMREEVEKQVDELLKEGVIRPSRSPYNSPIWVVPKKPKPNGEKQYRMVIDYKRLNMVTIPDTYPIPDINATLCSLGQANYYTTIDLTSGFHQIPMRELDIPKTAFSTLNGKYEFLRLPFGLRNAPAIFQRMIDDVLKEYIGKICYVYIDDIIVFGKDADEHLNNVEKVFSRLMEANLKVNLEKTCFFEKEVEFLGYVITPDGIRPNAKKVEAIKKILPPENLKALKSFLGMTSYYRKFIRDYAKVAKPLTNLTRGENAQIKANASRKVRIELDEKAMEAFHDLKQLLVSADVLAFPDFTKPFNLTTDASNYALGAVLSQGSIGDDHPIAFISRSLNKTEENYATNEKELLAIVWALDNLRSYLYGARKIRILTDHQPLTFSLSNRNYNAKLKRWKARIEEYNCELIYKPGKTNVVADALSRLKTEVNALTDSIVAHPPSDTDTASEGTMHSAEEDSSDLIPHVEVPINVFKNQIILRQGASCECSEEPHIGYKRFYITMPTLNREALVTILKKILNPNVINGIKIPECSLSNLQNVYVNNFSRYKIRVTQRVVEDVTIADRVFNIIEQEHKRAHRNARENREQILEKFYFPAMSKHIREYIANCETCKLNKYDRHPSVPYMQATPIPSYPCEILHIDIFEIERFKYLSCIDKFTKFAKLFPIKNKSSTHLRTKLTVALHYFSVPRTLVMDNERGFLTPLVINYIRSLGIQIYQTPTQRSEANGQVERLHSTLIEIYRCLRVELPRSTPQELVAITVDRYNNTVHSVIKRKPVDVFFNRTARINYQELANFRERTNDDIKALLLHEQQTRNARNNKRRSPPRNFDTGDNLFIANKQIKGKQKPLYKKETVAENRNATVITQTGKKFHKSDVKNV